MGDNRKVCIIGAGPAGLAAAYRLLKETDLKPIIFEESSYIGGISRTHRYKNNYMDLGGHRFFTKSEEVMSFWQEIMPIQDMPAKDDILLDRIDKFSTSGVNPEQENEVFLKRQRLSRIYFLKKFFDYPLKLNIQTLMNLGFKNLTLAGFGYIFSTIKKRQEHSLEDFYINRFGKPLYKMFFEDYTEKLWGIHPSKISPDWGAQRVKGLSLFKLLKNSLGKIFIKSDEVETSLIEEFYYPKFGPGQFYETLAGKIKKLGGEIRLNSKVVGFDLENNKISALHIIDEKKEESLVPVDLVVSSMPIKDLIKSFNTNVDEEIKNIANNLPYRDFITVGLLVKKFAIKNNTAYKTVSNIIPDCWIYIQERNVKLGRLQIFNNWSPYLVNDLENTVWLGLEYFCSEGDELWTMDENEFMQMAVDELDKIGIISKNDVLDKTMLHVKKAYPAYFGTYKDFDKLKKYLDNIENLYCVGRNGQHRYNNMDHSILTGFECANVIKEKKDKNIIWNVNTEKDYHESK